MERRPRFTQLNRRAIATIVALAIGLVIGSVALALGGVFTGFATTTATYSGYRLPWENGVQATSTSLYRSDHYNQVDFDIGGWAIPNGDVLAAKPGRIILIKEVQSQTGTMSTPPNHANLVVIEHAPNEYSWYVHLKHNSVPDNIVIGSQVGFGTKIGEEGNTGYSDGVHLHFMVTNQPPNKTGLISEPTVFPTWPSTSTIVPVNFYEASWSSLYNGRQLRSENGASGSCNGYESPGVSLFKHKDCVGPAAIEYTPGLYPMTRYPDWESGGDLNDKVSSISINRTWRLKVYREPTFYGTYGASRVMYGSNVYDRTKWDLSSDWYDYPYQNVPMNDSISMIDCAICDGAGALSAANVASVEGAESTAETCPLTPPTPPPPPQPTPTATTPPQPTPTPAPSASWSAKFYSSVDECSQSNCNPGSVYHQTSVSGESLDISFSDGRAYGTGTDRWGSIWTQTVNFPSGSYVFHSDHDDGVKLFINGINIMDVGNAENNNQTCPARSLSGSPCR